MVAAACRDQPTATGSRTTSRRASRCSSGRSFFARLTESVPLDEGLADRALAQFLAAHRS
jgi:hypothetical protein